MKEIIDFSTAEKIELLRSILDEIVVSGDYFSEDGIADIKQALNEVACGELVDLDVFFIWRQPQAPPGAYTKYI